MAAASALYKENQCYEFCQCKVTLMELHFKTQLHYIILTELSYLNGIVMFC